MAADAGALLLEHGVAHIDDEYVGSRGWASQGNVDAQPQRCVTGYFVGERAGEWRFCTLLRFVPQFPDAFISFGTYLRPQPDAIRLLPSGDGQWKNAADEEPFSI